MDTAERRQRGLVRGLSDPEFVEALIERIVLIRETYESRLHVDRKGDMDEHIMSLVTANGACVALDRVETEIRDLHEEARKEQP